MKLDRPAHKGYPTVGRSPWIDHPRSLLGKQVEVLLQREGPQGQPAQVVARGQLLAFEDSGQVAVEDDMGFVHYCWPMLEIRPLTWDEEDARRHFARQMAQVDEAERAASRFIAEGHVIR